MNLDWDFMKKAISLGKKGADFVAGEPMLGVVIVNEGQVVAESYRGKKNAKHPIVAALELAGECAEGASLYINMEPSGTNKKGEPYVNLIIKAGVEKVFCAMEDVNPENRGKAVEALRNAGVTVDLGLMEKKARKLNEIYIVNQEQHRAFVALKAATTLDGRIATVNGSSRWITGEETKYVVYRLRNRYGAVLTGKGTVNFNNPQMTIPTEDQIIHPVRVLLTDDLAIKPDLNWFAGNERKFIYTAYTDSCTFNKDNKNIEIIEMPNEEKDGVELLEVLQDLYKRGINSVLVEAGSQLNGAFFDAKLIDKYYHFFAPKICGGNLSLPVFAGRGIEYLADTPTIENPEVIPIDGDFLISGNLIWNKNE